MRFILTLPFAMFLLSCGVNEHDNNVTWQYLKGPWKFEDSSVTYLEYFWQTFDNTSNVGNPNGINNGEQDVFIYPDSTDSLIYCSMHGFNLDLENGILLNSNSFTWSSYTGQIEKINNNEMIIKYSPGYRNGNLNIHYFRVNNLVINQGNGKWTITRKK